MALGALTLSTTSGVQGRRFAAKISGLTTGKVEVGLDGAPGFSVVNGMVMHPSLPALNPTVLVLREIDPGAATSIKETRIQLDVATKATIDAKAASLLGNGRTIASQVVASTAQADGSTSYAVYVRDDLGATVSATISAVLPVFRAAVQRVKSGTGRGMILVIDDSTGFGDHAGDGASYGSDYNASEQGAHLNSWPYKMADALTAGGIKASANGFWGDGGCYTYNDYGTPVANPQLLFGNGAAGQNRSQGYTTLGGSLIVVGQGGSQYVTLTPRNAVTKIRMYFANTIYGYGTYGYQIDGGALQTVTYAKPPTDLTGSGAKLLEVGGLTKGTHALAMNCTSGGGLHLIGGYGIDETTPAIDIVNAGNRGSVAADWISTNSADGYSGVPSWSALGMIATLRPDLVLIKPRINDLQNGTSIAAFIANLTTLVLASKAAGADVMLINSAATRAGGPNNRPSQAVSDTYTAAIKLVAATLGLPPVTDLEAFLGAWTTAEYYDDFHPLKVRQAAMGNKVASDLLALAA